MKTFKQFDEGMPSGFTVEIPKQTISGKTYGGGKTPVFVKAKTARQAISMVARRLGVDFKMLKVGKVVKEGYAADKEKKQKATLAKHDKRMIKVARDSIKKYQSQKTAKEGLEEDRKKDLKDLETLSVAYMSQKEKGKDANAEKLNVEIQKLQKKLGVKAKSDGDRRKEYKAYQKSKR